MKKKYIKNIRFIVLIYFAFAGNVWAQPNIVSDLNTRHITARCAGLGGAIAPLVDDASALHLNPSGLAKMKKTGFVLSGNLAARMGGLTENGSVPNYSSSSITDNDPMFGIEQADLGIRLGHGFGLGLGYAKYSNFSRLKEKWEVKQYNSGSTGYDRLEYNYHGALHVASAGLGFALGKQENGGVSAGIAVNQLFGNREMAYDKKFVVNGSTTSSTVYQVKAGYSALFISYGLQWSSAEKNQGSGSESGAFQNQYTLSIHGNLPYWRLNNVTASQGAPNAVGKTNTYKPGTMVFAAAGKFIRNKTTYSTAFITPVIQYEWTDLDQNREYYPTTQTQGTPLTGMTSNRLGVGLEFSNTYDDMVPRLGIHTLQYAVKNGSGVSNPGKQPTGWGVSGGFGNEFMDMTMRLDFFKSEKVLVYSNGAGIDYKGVVLSLMVTYRFM
ncbi:MAG: hypothetical protein JNL57_11865 [Bacteroidetes bacterium]|nr:hypothetical protein [Bacteroidota bacterium]